MEEKLPKEFTSALTKKETVFCTLALILHIALLPFLLGLAFERGLVGEETANFTIYALMAVYTVVFMWGFLRREFDALADHLAFNVFEVITGYAGLIFFNLAINSLLLIFFDLDNPNTDSVNEMIVTGSGSMRATVIFLAPIVEETLFRALLFGCTRKRSRVWAYVLSVAAFALYHLWGFIITDISSLIYLVQYIPAGILLCRCYERTNTIWAPMMMHALVNAVSVSLLT